MIYPQITQIFCKNIRMSMEIFEVGKIILEQKINDDLWVFSISKVFQLTEEEYANNGAFNDTLGNYDPENELPTSSVVTIIALNNSGGSIKLFWSCGIKGVYPYIRKKGWSKGLFIKLNKILQKWKLP